MSWEYGQTIWNFLLADIGNELGVAAMMGNLHAESGMIPNNLQNSYETSLGYTDESYTAAVDNGTYTESQFVNDAAGYGLAQWTYYSRKQRLYDLKQEKGVSIADLDLQLEYLLWELKNSYSGVYSVLKTATSIREASDSVLFNFENPEVQTEAVQELRASYGLSVYETYTGSSAPDTPVTPDTPDTPSKPSSGKKQKYKFVLFKRKRRWY